VTAGYEDNEFFLTRERGAIYGLGVGWHPDDRTSLTASWEHRFFGGSYDFAFTHSSRLTVWSVNASRNITSYPQQLATLAQGGSVSNLLNVLYQSRIPDPLARQAFVDELIRNRGLPLVVGQPLPLLAQQIALTESASASAGILGARNAIVLSVFRSRQQPLPGDELASLAVPANNNIQLGASVAWTHQLTPVLTLGTNLNWSRTTAIDAIDKTQFYSLTAYVMTLLSPLTSFQAGARFQDSRSNVSESYREAAVFVGLAHTFH
jgi:uncharacterized protein (PEP-CTERM system associated)